MLCYRTQTGGTKTLVTHCQENFSEHCDDTAEKFFL